jgi:hypothetical protein
MGERFMLIAENQGMNPDRLSSGQKVKLGTFNK